MRTYEEAVNVIASMDAQMCMMQDEMLARFIEDGGSVIGNAIKRSLVVMKQERTHFVKAFTWAYDVSAHDFESDVAKQLRS